MMPNKEEIKACIEVMQAYVNGAEIQVKTHGSNIWSDTCRPEFDWVENDYRVKPREFRRGAWYPVIDEDGFKTIGIYQDGAFIVNGAELHPENLDWIGEPLKKIHHPENRDLFSEPLKIDWPEES